MNQIKFYTNELANIPIIPQLQQSSTPSDSRISLSSSQPLTFLPRLPLSISNRQSSSSQVSLPSTSSPRENRLFSKASTFRKSLVESKENISQSQYFYKIDKAENKNDAITLLTERISKLEEKNECNKQEKEKDEAKKDRKEISDIVSRIVIEKFDALNSKMLVCFDEKFESLHEEITQFKQKLTFPLPISPELETLRLCKSMIDDKIIGEKIERIKSIREESERLHDKFNFQNKMWNEKLEHEHKYVENSIQGLRNSLGELGKTKMNVRKEEGNHSEDEVDKNMFSLKEVVNRLELIEEKLIKAIPDTQAQNSKTTSISEFIASLHLQITLKSLSCSQSESSLLKCSPSSTNRTEASYTYMIDRDGCMVDEKGFYLLDLSNKMIKLSREQIKRLEESGLMEKMSE